MNVLYSTINATSGTVTTISCMPGYKDNNVEFLEIACLDRMWNSSVTMRCNGERIVIK